MNEIFGGIKQLFWNPDELRLRALFRVSATIGVGLLAFTLIFNIGTGIAGIFGLSTTAQTILIQAIGIASAIVLVWFLDRRRLRDMGLTLDYQWGRDLLAGFLVGAGMLATVIGVLAAIGGADVTFDGVSESLLVELGQAALFFAGVAFLEEFIFRGYLLVNIAEGLKGYTGSQAGTRFSVVVTAILFAFGHIGNSQAILALLNLSFAGLLLGFAYAVTTRLALPIGIHLAWNFGLGPVFGFAVSGNTQEQAIFNTEVTGPALVTGGSFGPEGGVAMLIGLGVGVAVFVWWVRRQYGTLAINERIAIPDLWVTDSDDS